MGRSLGSGSDAVRTGGGSGELDGEEGEEGPGGRCVDGLDAARVEKGRRVVRECASFFFALFSASF